MKKLLSLACALALTLTCVTGVLPGAAAAEKAAGTTYYVSNKGVGDNNGTSKEAPLPGLDAVDWAGLQPGDSVLLEKGSTFDGFIHLVNVRGTKENPIKIGAYGEENAAMPIINGKGQGIWFQDYGVALDNAWHKSTGYVSSTILLYDCDFIEISGLEITNEVPNEEARFQPGEFQGAAVPGSMDRTGVAGAAKDGGTMEHIYLDNLYIHDVDGNIQDKHMNNGGIQLNALKPADESATGIARYDDVRIMNCRVKNVSRAGIVVGYTYKWSLFQTAELDDAVVQKNGHTGLHMANNYIKDAGNDALVALYAYRPLVENNISDGAGADLPTYAGSTQRFCAAIWPWKCKDAVFQNNEAFNTESEGNGDGQAWDVDWSDGTIYQYNYSHNNAMGPILFCLDQATNGVFRYNLSQNDLGCYMTLQGNPNAKIYNNVFYTGAGMNVKVLHENAGKNGGNAWIANNIFYNDGGTVEENWAGSGGTKTYTHNLYFGFNTQPAGDVNKVVVTDKSKVFANPGKAPIATTGIISSHTASDGTTAFDGFKLAANSPAINGGVPVENNGGKDFFGNKLDATPDIGIYDSRTGMALASTAYTIDNVLRTISKIPTGTTVADFVSKITTDSGVTVAVKNASNAIITGTALVDLDGKVTLTAESRTLDYTFIKDTDNALKTALFDVRGQTISVPVTALIQTTVADLKAGVTVADTATVAVTGVADSAVLTAGMKLVVTAQDDKTNEYTVAIKNNYNHTDDFVNQTQGNIWYYQRKQNDNYTNFTQWTAEGGGGWWGGAVPDFTSAEKVGLCGDAQAERTYASSAFAFHAPVAGMVQVSFPVQATFRNPNSVNNVGTANLVLTLNGEPLPGKDWQIPTYGNSLSVSSFTVDLVKDDWLRFEIVNRGGALAQGGVALNPLVAYMGTDPAKLPGIHSNVYNIDDDIDNISQVPYGTAQSAFMASITCGEKTTAVLMNGAAEVTGDTTAVTAGMKLQVTVEGSDPVDYTITVLPRPITGYKDYDRTGWTATAGSEEPTAGLPGEGPARLALDGNTGTKWHTVWDGGNSLKQELAWIAIDMKAEKLVGRIGYQARPTQKAGNFYDYVVEISADGTTWIEHASGSWDKDTVDGDRTKIHYAEFEPVTTQYIRLRATRSDESRGCATEIYVAAPTYE